MRKKGKIPVKVYEALRSTGAQPARLYGLAKVHKKETHLRPVLSIPGSCYHNQTCRHITTRFAEHAKADSPIGVHAIVCNGDKTDFQWKILDQCSNQSKLMTLEALYIRTLKSAINTRDEYRTR